jgi:sugar lactone lactonase YvrE
MPSLFAERIPDIRRLCLAAISLRRVLSLALVGASFHAAVPLQAQTFVAEWAEADIGRIGPTGLALDTIGGTTVLYVADQNHGRILKFNAATGARLAAWGTTGNADGEFNSPFGIAIDPRTHDLYVAERGNNRISRITSSGTFVMKWGAMGSGPGQFAGPVGVAADAAGNVYVTDHGNHRVQKFRVQGGTGNWEVQHVGTWGSRGSANGQFDGPYGITLDSAGVLWIADGFNHRLQKMDTNGNFMGSVGTAGTGNGQFITPTWVNFDAAGNYYVSESNSDPQNASAPDLQNQRIQKFTATGAFVTKWGAYGEAPGQFRLPFNVVVDDAGNAYVSDYYNTRVQKFSQGGAPPAPPPPPTGGEIAAHFVNLSSRLHTMEGSASRAFIAGFVVSGSISKPMLIRAVGPGLGQFGVGGALTNPRLQIYAGNQLVAENEDWIDTATLRSTSDRVGAFPLAAGSRDAAILLTLPPGAYSARVSPNGGNGVALVEVYDAETAQPAAQLVNLSTRGFVETGDGVLVAGFVVTGAAAKRVLVRGIGPALTAFGVDGALGDAVLKIYRGNTVVAQNDDWGTPQPVAGAPGASAAEIASAAQASGAFALTAGSKDAALVVTLAPGAYSAVVSGANNTTGAGLVEVYELPNP